MDYSKLSDAEINQSVTCIINPDAGGMALIGDGSCFYDCGPDGSQFHEIPIPDYCNNAADAWPIIVGNRISLDSIYERGEKWLVFSGEDGEFRSTDAKPLRAAMIVFLMMQGE